MLKGLRRTPHWRYKVAFGIGMGLLGTGMIVVGGVIGGIALIAFATGGILLWIATGLTLYISCNEAALSLRD